jgi:hypothetical protein
MGLASWLAFILRQCRKRPSRTGLGLSAVELGLMGVRPGLYAPPGIPFAALTAVGRKLCGG